MHDVCMLSYKRMTGVMKPHYGTAKNEARRGFLAVMQLHYGRKTSMTACTPQAQALRGLEPAKTGFCIRDRGKT